MKPPLIAFVCIFVWASNAGAQTAESFEQLRALVHPGDVVSVQDVTGGISRGEIKALSNSSLTLQASALLREYSEEQVLAVMRRQPDSLGNGALIGLAVGGGVGLVASMSTCGGNSFVNICEGGTALALAGIWGGIGAAIGLGIDAAIVHEHAVYRAPGHVSRISIQPIYSAGRRGVTVLLSR